MSLPLKLLVGVILAAIAQTVYYLPQLPERMASHFDAAGRANGWMSRAQSLEITALIFGLQMFFFGALPFLIRTVPASMVNIPNRTYWLAPAHRDATMRMLQDWLHTFGVVIGIFFLGIMQQVYQANLAGTGINSTVAIAWASCFLAAMLLWIFWMLRRLVNLPDGSPAGMD